VSIPSSSLFFLNDPSTTEIYTLSLHDALPICSVRSGWTMARPRIARSQAICVFVDDGAVCGGGRGARVFDLRPPGLPAHARAGRSEEHTSELQSLTNLVCRLLLEKRKELTAAL